MLIFQYQIRHFTREHVCDMLICSRRKKSKRRKRLERPAPPPGTHMNEYVEVKETQERNALRRHEGILGFNKTEAAVFLCRLCFLRDFPFISLI